jgi:hypothetical protein
VVIGKTTEIALLNAWLIFENEFQHFPCLLPNLWATDLEVCESTVPVPIDRYLHQSHQLVLAMQVLIHSELQKIPRSTKLVGQTLVAHSLKK